MSSLMAAPPGGRGAGGRGRPARGRHAEGAGGELADVSLLVTGGDEPGVTTSKLHVHAKRLEIAADNVGAVVAGRGEDAQRDRIDAHDRPGAPGVRQAGDLRGL